jgi:hypothetical protein
MSHEIAGRRPVWRTAYTYIKDGNTIKVEGRYIWVKTNERRAAEARIK